MTLKEIIQIASDAYDADGIVMQYFEDITGAHGDGLAEFIVKEITETYEEDATTEVQLKEAYRVMLSADKQISRVVAELSRSASLEASYRLVCDKCFRMTYPEGAAEPCMGALNAHTTPCALCGGPIEENNYHWMHGCDVRKGRAARALLISKEEQ